MLIFNYSIFRACLVLSLCTFLLSRCSPPESENFVYSGHGIGSIDPKVLAQYPPIVVPNEELQFVARIFAAQGSGNGFPTNNGETIYFSWNVTGSTQIWQLSLANAQVPRRISLGKGRTRLAGLSPDAKWIAALRDTDGEEYFGLYLFSTNGGAPHALMKGKKLRVHFDYFSEDSKHLVYHVNNVNSVETSFYRHNLQTQKSELLFSQNGNWSISDHTSNGQKILLYKKNSSLSGEAYEYDLYSETLRPLFGQGENSIFSAKYGPDDGEIIVLTDHFENFRRLYSWKRSNSGEQTFLPISIRVDHDIESFHLDPQRRRILYVENRDGYYITRGLNAKNKQEISVPKSVPSENLLPLNSSSNSRFTIFAANSSDAPVKHYLYDWQTRKIKLWSFPSEIVSRSKNPIDTKLVAIPQKDGDEIPAVLHIPFNCRRERCPVLIKVHGGPASQARPIWNASTTAIVQSGFIVIEPNIAGSRGYGRERRDADNRHLRPTAFAELVNVGIWAKSQFRFERTPPKVGIFGRSYGGYATLLMQTKFAGNFDAGVSTVGMTNLKSFLENTSPARRELRIAEYGDPKQDAAFLTDISPLTHLEKLESPLLLIHGANDIRVPAGESVQMQRKLEKAKPQLSQLMIFPREGHVLLKEKNKVHETAAIITFFKKHLRNE